jgi:copper chaperone
MTCQHCEMAVKNSLNREGVENVNVNLKDGKVSLDYDQGKVNLEQIKDAIEDAGYSVES